jgi:hypothetical protein
VAGVPGCAALIRATDACRPDKAKGRIRGDAEATGAVLGGAMCGLGRSPDKAEGRIRGGAEATGAARGGAMCGLGRSPDKAKGRIRDGAQSGPSNPSNRTASASVV